MQMAEMVDTDPGRSVGPEAPSSTGLPQLSPDLQAALERVRRREGSKTLPHPVVPPMVGIDLDLDLGD